MPLVRILTFDPGDAADFSRRLQQLGFEVEIADPNEEQLTPADLEIEFAVCDQQQVLGRASAIAAQLSSEIVVFPGAIPPLPRPIPVVTEQVAFSSNLEEAPVERAEIIGQSSIEHVQEAAHLLQDDHSPELDQTIQEEPIPETPSVLAQLFEGLRNRSMRLKVNLAGALARLKSASASTAGALAGQGHRIQESVRQHIAQARAAHEHHLAELRRRREEAERERQQRRQADLAAAAHLQDQELPPVPVTAMQSEDLQRVQAEKERLIAEVEHLREDLQQARLASGELPQPQLSVLAKRSASKPVKTVRKRNGQLRGALAGAAAAIFLFLVGVVLANFQAIVPVSHSLYNGSVEQQVPFGETTIHGAPGVTNEGGPVGGANPAKPAGVRPTPQAQSQAKPQPTRSSAPVAKQQSQWHRFRQRSSSEDKATADDVTITHFTPPRKPTRSAQQQAQLKRYSDE